jgi:hypothetical protein
MSRDVCDSVPANPTMALALRASIINLGKLSKLATEEFKKLFPELAEQVDHQEDDNFYHRRLCVARSNQLTYVDEGDILLSIDLKFFFKKVSYDTIKELIRIGEAAFMHVYPDQLMDITYRTSFDICNNKEINKYKLSTKDYEFSFGCPANADDGDD